MSQTRPYPPVINITADTYADLPDNYIDGALGTTKDTDTAYVFDGPTNTWVVVTAVAVIVPGNVTDTATIDMTVTAGVISSDVVAGSIGNTQLASGIDATKIADGSVTDAEFQYLGGVTSDIQTQIDGKQPVGSYQPLDADLTAIAALATTGYASRTGAGTWAVRTFQNSTTLIWGNPGGVGGNTSGDIQLDSITDAYINNGAAIALTKLAAVTASRVLVSTAGGFVSASGVTATTLAFLDATSSIQTQLNAKQPLDTGLTNIAALTGTGLVCSTATDTYALRSLTVVSDPAAFVVTNPAGVSGNPTITYQDVRTPNATNATFVGVGMTASATGATATNLQSATVTFSTDSLDFVVEIGVGANERAAIKCFAAYGTAAISASGDPGGYFLAADAGTGVFISKSASSGVVTIKNRMGGSRVIRVYAINTTITATAWA